MNDFQRYDDLVIGRVYPDEPASFSVTREGVEAYRSLTGSATAGPDVAPPTLAAVYIRPAQNALRGPPGGIHAKQGFQFHVPVKVGDTLSTTLTIVDTYELKGRRYVVSETRTMKQDGVLVTTGRITQIWGKEP